MKKLWIALSLTSVCAGSLVAFDGRGRPGLPGAGHGAGPMQSGFAAGGMMGGPGGSMGGMPMGGGPVFMGPPVGAVISSQFMDGKVKNLVVTQDGEVEISAQFAAACGEARHILFKECDDAEARYLVKLVAGRKKTLPFVVAERDHTSFGGGEDHLAHDKAFREKVAELATDATLVDGERIDAIYECAQGLVADSGVDSVWSDAREDIESLSGFADLAAALAVVQGQYAAALDGNGETA